MKYFVWSFLIFMENIPEKIFLQKYYISQIRLEIK